MKKDDLKRKLKRERVEICLNCKHFMRCNEIGQNEVCECFCEVQDEKQFVIVSLQEYAKLNDGES